MSFVGAILMLLALSVLIIVHELGHFWVARFFGFQTPVFGFGLPFGPRWTLGRFGDTEIRLHALLLGGYVAIPELGDESSMNMDVEGASIDAGDVLRDENSAGSDTISAADNPYGVPLKPFRKFPIWQRALVAFAGPGFNIIFAWLVLFIIITTLGDPSQKVIVAELPPENPIAAKAGIHKGDQVISIDKTRIGSVEDILVYLGQRPNTPVVVHVARDGAELDLPMTTNARGKVGMALDREGPTIFNKVDRNPIDTAIYATDKLNRLTGQMLQGMGMMFEGIYDSIVHPQPKATTSDKHKFGFKDLHGVLAVVKIGADIASQDWSQLPLFVVMISMDLAIINLVPWPGLDGSHLAFMLWEAVRGKPMEERKRGTIVQWGFISLLVLMVVIMYNDIEALVTGKLDVKMKNKHQQQKESPSSSGSTAGSMPASTTGDGTAAPAPSTDASTPAPNPESAAPAPNPDAGTPSPNPESAPPAPKSDGNAPAAK